MCHINAQSSITHCTNDVTKLTNKVKFCNKESLTTNKVKFCKRVREYYANGDQCGAMFFSVLTDEDSVAGSKSQKQSEEYTFDKLKRWLKCRGLKLNGKRDVVFIMK